MSSVTNSFQQVSKWTELLQKITPKDNKAPHDSLYLIRVDKQLCYEAFSEERHAEYIKENPNSLCRKLSFSEIISTTNSFLDNLTLKDFKRDIMTTVQHSDLSSADNPLSDRLQTFQSDIKNIKDISNSLYTIAERSKAKHLAKYESGGVIEKIKWFVWSLFFDNSSKVSELNRDISQIKNNALQIFKKDVLDEVKERTLINMDTFEEVEIKNSDDRLFSFIDEEKEAKFQEPLDIKKKWLTRYHPDKWTAKNERAQEAFEKVIVLVQIWDDIKKLDTNEEIKGTKPPIPSGPLFLK